LCFVQADCSATSRSLIKSNRNEHVCVCVCVCVCVTECDRCNSNPQRLQSELAEEVLIRKKIYLKIFISLDFPQLYSLHIISHAVQKVISHRFQVAT